MIRQWISRLCFLAGLALLAWPLAARIQDAISQSQTLASFRQETEQIDHGRLEAIKEQAEKYNEALANGTEPGIDILPYEEQLALTSSGILASIEIPRIDVSLPVFHGTGEDVLAAGAGHLEGSSLPTGGSSTRAIITAHRGLPNARLFTRLDELQKGDLIFIRTCRETLAYQVERIEVIEPEDVGSLAIEKGEDLLSLVTCTPYGINTHRLVITARRTDYEPGQEETIQPALPGIREICFTAAPLVLLAAGIWRLKRKQ